MRNDASRWNAVEIAAPAQDAVDRLEIKTILLE